MNTPCGALAFRGRAWTRFPNRFWLWQLLLPLVVFAQVSNDIPPLRPPHPELPPTLWEQHGAGMLALGVTLLSLVALAVWWRLRPKAVVDVPIEIQTHHQLEALRAQNENGKVLSEVSRSLRRYLTIAFRLPVHELTTTEFCQAISSRVEIEPELGKSLCAFLRQCDERKFAPIQPAPPVGAAERALQLVEHAEAHRALLRRAAHTEQRSDSSA